MKTFILKCIEIAADYEKDLKKFSQPPVDFHRQKLKNENEVEKKFR